MFMPRIVARSGGGDDGWMLEIRLLGPFELRVDGTAVALTSSRAQSLLAYLALRPGTPQRRDRVAFLRWPESTDQQARTNLRHVLHTMRGAIPDADRHLRATAQTLALHDVSTDVQEFDAATPRDAADLYRGDLLDGWYDAIVALFASQRAGSMTGTTDTVRELTGRPPRTIADFARENAAAFHFNTARRVPSVS
jgi:hypothetical protein